MSAQVTSTVLSAVPEAWNAGLAPIPIRMDGTKRPALPIDDPHLGRGAVRFTLEEALEQFAGPRALGIQCGAASGGLELLEVEGKAVEEGIWERLWDSWPEELRERVRRGYLEWSPSGGVHLLYRVEGGAPGNTKLARRPRPDLGARCCDTLIETRGEGGFVVVAPSPGTAHESGNAWELDSGGFGTIATITAAERESLVSAARAFDKMPPEPEWPPKVVRPKGAGLRPGEDYDRRHTCGEVLEAHGWTVARRRGDEVYWRRPGKSGHEAHSGVEHLDEPNRFVNWSSSVDLECEVGYSAFALYAHLEHGGDFSAAARELGAKGYGESRSKGHTRREAPEGASQRLSQGHAASAEDTQIVAGPYVPEQASSNGHAATAVESLPPYPVEAFPPSLRVFVETCCASVSTTPEMLAPMVMAAAGGLIGHARSCGIKADWQEVPSLWTLAVAEPGMRKSPVFKRAMAGPMAVHADLRAAWEREKEVFEALGNGEQRKAPKPVRQRLVVDDTTIEALGRTLLTNPRGVILANDELGGWAKGMGQYKKGSNADRQKWLSLWSHGLLLVDRVSLEESIEVEDPCVAILGATQPDALPDFLRAGVQDGMLHRFLLSAPADVIEDPDSPSVSQEVKVGWLTACRRLHALTGTRPIEVTPEGLEALKDTLRAIYTRKREPGMPAAMRGFWDKADAHLLRLAAVIAELWHVAGGCDEQVTAAVAGAAWEVLEFHLAHAAHLILDRGLLESGDFERATPSKERELVDWLRGRPDQTATRREAMKYPLHRMALKDAEAVISAAAARGRLVVRNAERGSTVLVLSEE